MGSVNRYFDLVTTLLCQLVGRQAFGIAYGSTSKLYRPIFIKTALKFYLLCLCPILPFTVLLQRITLFMIYQGIKENVEIFSPLANLKIFDEIANFKKKRPFLLFS